MRKPAQLTPDEELTKPQIPGHVRAATRINKINQSTHDQMSSRKFVGIPADNIQRFRHLRLGFRPSLPFKNRIQGYPNDRWPETFASAEDPSVWPSFAVERKAVPGHFCNQRASGSRNLGSYIQNPQLLYKQGPFIFSHWIRWAQLCEAPCARTKI